MQHRVGHLREIPDREALIVDVNRRSIGVFNVDGRLYAVRNVCPHKQAPLCRERWRARCSPANRESWSTGTRTGS